MNNPWPAMGANPVVTVEPAPQVDTGERDKAILDWRRLKTELGVIQQQERECREKVTRLCFPTPTKGTQRFELGRGYKLKLVYTLTYSLGDKDKINPNTGQKVPVEDQVNEILDAIEALGNEGPMLADRLVKWKPELNVPEYEKLNPELETEGKIKALIDSILTIKPGAPQLTLEEPKEK